jgi:hypothetical protein
MTVDNTFNHRGPSCTRRTFRFYLACTFCRGSRSEPFCTDFLRFYQTNTAKGSRKTEAAVVAALFYSAGRR